MKSIICENFGPLNSLVYKEVETPEIQNPSDVLIKVFSSGVNFPDGLLVQGKYQLKPHVPFTPGMEVSGEVLSIGSEVTEFKIGDRVAGLSQLGGYSEYIVLNKNAVYKIPLEMNHDQACALLCAYGTSHYALKQRAQLKKGNTLVVLGASGSTGVAAIQIGKTMGAKVIAASSSIEKQQYTKGLGADITIGYDNIKDQLKDLTNNIGVDVIFDPVGGELFEESSRALSRYGKILVIGFASGKIPKFPINLALVKEFDVVGVFWGAFTGREPDLNAKNLNEINQMLKDGEIKPLVSKTFPMERAVEAINLIGNRGVIGK